MTRWTYYNGRRGYLLSAEASERIDAEWRQVWRSADAIFEVAAKEVREGVPTPRRLWPWRLLMVASLMTWLAALLWLDRYVL